MRELQLHGAPLATLRAQRWYARNTVPSAATPGAAALAAMKGDATISVVLPAVNEGETVGAICRTIRDELMTAIPLVDELVVIDGGSTDDTAQEAARNGAHVVTLSSILPEVPELRGKGESLWRSLAVTSGDIVVWIDADIRNFAPHFVTRLVSPLLHDEKVMFTKGFYRRPLQHGDVLEPTGGGRVTELLARPLLNAFFPELSGFVQPLSGEYAGRRAALQQVPFFTGYSVDAGLLIDLAHTVGLDAMVQVDLDERVHRNRSLRELSPMAYAIGQTVLRRAEELGRMKASIDFPAAPLLMPCEDGTVKAIQVLETERPPMEITPSYVEAMRSSELAAAMP